MSIFLQPSPKTLLHRVLCHDSCSERSRPLHVAPPVCHLCMSFLAVPFFCVPSPDKRNEETTQESQSLLPRSVAQQKRNLPSPHRSAILLNTRCRHEQRFKALFDSSVEPGRISPPSPWLCEYEARVQRRGASVCDEKQSK